jgi:hypothetical protein
MLGLKSLAGLSIVPNSIKLRFFELIEYRFGPFVMLASPLDQLVFASIRTVRF